MLIVKKQMGTFHLNCKSYSCRKKYGTNKPALLLDLSVQPDIQSKACLHQTVFQMLVPANRSRLV